LILTDTGFWLALANRKDRHHAACKRVLAGVAEPLVTTWPVMTETCHLLLARIGVDAELKFLASAREGAFGLFSPTEGHLPRMQELMERYRDLPMDLADASLVIAAEDLGDGRILSTDGRDFHAYRWKNRKPLRNLLVL
jgi:predicted nucleic acid-binding protein